MEHHKKDILGVLLFLIVLFIAWIFTGGPEKAVQSGSANNKYIDLPAPAGSGETYNVASQKPAAVPFTLP